MNAEITIRELVSFQVVKRSGFIYINFNMFSKVPFTVVDVETTGSRPGIDHIIEIGAVKVFGGKIRETFFTMVNPGRSIPRIITNITGIRDSHVADAPAFFEVARRLRAFLDGSIFVAHNAQFDYHFINSEFRIFNHEPITTPMVCTLKLARKIFPGLRRYNLVDLCSSLGISLNHAHRARHDAMATAHLLIKILQKIKTERPISI